MKAIIGRGVIAVGLGSALLLTGCRESASVASTSMTPGASAFTTPGSTLVNCGVGTQALIRQATPGSSAPMQVECVPVAPPAYGTPYGAMVRDAEFQSDAVYRPAPTVRERVVYRDRPVYRTASTSARYERPSRTRSWKKSALIIGGSAAGGAGLGAILGGGSGAKKGAVIGGVAGTVYDLATRNKGR
jgi:hypothetical protein